MNEHSIYEDIAARTGGDIYLGVVGPVRTGKSTFIKRFMETLVLPGIENAYTRERARDELPQSASGRTVMTAEPKFVPEEAARLTLDGGADVSVRLIDCVGFMVPGAAGQFEDGRERMVTTPWLEEEVPLTEAAELGTRKVISEHSTIGVVVTTDGSIGEIPREDFVEAETRVVNELRAIGKPFIIVINSSAPDATETEALRAELSEKHSVTCIAKNVQRMDARDIAAVLKSVLYEFPIREMGVFLPAWVDALPLGHPIKSSLMDSVRRAAPGLHRIRDADGALTAIAADENVSNAAVSGADLGRGTVAVTLDVPRELFYGTLSAQSGFDVRDDGDLISLLTDLSDVKREYDRIDSALRDVRERGYGIVMPSREELRLEEPEIVRQGGRYGVKLKASAPSIHMLMANIETEVSPAVGGERSNEDVINFLLQEFEGDVSKIWESNMFGKSLYDIAGEGLNAKIKKMPEETQMKLRGTLQRIINEGSGGIICIIL
ncbi:MAG: stage IV sporulation protein A [Oscillospiraceae bacterium]|nr:stage IV sporulation protein A [Oscillospiraceae bacterium]